MTKAEKIEMLEAQLKVARLDLEEAKNKIEDYEKEKAHFAFIEPREAILDARGFHEHFWVHYTAAPFGEGQFGIDSFAKAIDMFCKKWNAAALEAQENEYKVK